MDKEHMIVWCMKCKIQYDMDFEEAIDDDHEGCYSEDWLIDLVPCGIFSNCDCAPPAPRTKPLPDLSALPKG